MNSSAYVCRILIVDDDCVTRQYYENILRRVGYRVDASADLTEMQTAIRAVFYDVILIDVHLEKESGLDGLTFLLKASPYSKVIILTSDERLDLAVSSMKIGATGFLTKGMPPQKLLDEITCALKNRSEKILFDSCELATLGLVGESDAIRETVRMIERLKNVDSTVLILGESGSGKEVVARAIHKKSSRFASRFDAINCSAIPENLLESELFGHKKGAFTDAKVERKGIFEVCSEGTLLLDEIGDMPIALQTKILRVLQEKQVTPIGSTTPVSINTRVIAATHRDIFEEAKSKRFREDLYYRLSVVVIKIPPLRRRIEDIPILTQYFLNQFNERFERNVRPPNSEILSRMRAYDWPGNVRELQNAVERGVVFAQNDELDLADMFQHIDQRIVSRSSGSTLDVDLLVQPLTEAKQAFEKIYLENLLKSCRGNISEASRISGRYRADIYRLMHRYALDQGEFR